MGPSSSASRSRRMPSPSASVIRSSGLAVHRHLVVHLPDRVHPPDDVRLHHWQGWSSASSMVAVQVGYTVSDVISKCGVGFLVYNIALSKSMMERGEMEDGCVKADV